MAFDETARSGIWQCEGPAQFEWHYGNDETIYILEGAAEIEYLGKKFLLEPGSSTRFAYGTKAIWTVPQHVRKTYLIHNPGPVLKRITRLAD